MKLRKDPFGPKIAALLMIFSFLAIAPAAAAKEGFGGGAKEWVRMERLVPPKVALGAARFAVRVGGPEAGNAWSRQLEVQLEKEIAARNPELVRDQEQPQVRIELTLARNRLTDRWESKKERERKQIGIAPNGNSIFQSVEVDAHYRVIVREVSVSFQVIQAEKGEILDSGSIEAPFEGRFRDGEKAPQAAALETEAMGLVIDGIASRVALEREPILVLLPKGRLEGFAALARAGQWSRYRDEVAALSPSPDAKDEAYRQYALATASEALAYAAAGGAERLENLQLAESGYQAAIAAHPGEKLFARKSEAKEAAAAAPPPLERVRAALGSFRSSE